MCVCVCVCVCVWLCACVRVWKAETVSSGRVGYALDSHSTGQRFATLFLLFSRCMSLRA